MPSENSGPKTRAATAARPSLSTGTRGSRRPNIVFILTDNLGYGDIGVYGGGEVRGAPTPRIDALAREGLRLTNFNVEPECTPSRSALMTGRMPIRSGTSKVAFGGLPEGLAPWEYTLAECWRTAATSPRRLENGISATSKEDSQQIKDLTNGGDFRIAAMNL